MNDALETVILQVCSAAKRAYQCGLQAGNGGNLSARLFEASQLIIKGSGKSFGECSSKTLTVIDFNGLVLEGELKPSREYLTHVAIYKNLPEVKAIMHCHAPWSIAMAALVDELPLITHHMKMKLGDVPVLTIGAHADAQMAKATTTFLQEHPGIKAFIHREHGLFSFGADITEAEHNAELVEESAKIAFLVRLGNRGY